MFKVNLNQKIISVTGKPFTRLENKKEVPITLGFSIVDWLGALETVSTEDTLPLYRLIEKCRQEGTKTFEKEDIELLIKYVHQTKAKFLVKAQMINMFDVAIQNAEK